ncbi:hypothetical protein MASR2M70_13520 [Bacillota bacterium]
MLLFGIFAYVNEVLKMSAVSRSLFNRNGAASRQLYSVLCQYFVKGVNGEASWHQRITYYPDVSPISYDCSCVEATLEMLLDAGNANAAGTGIDII